MWKKILAIIFGLSIVNASLLLNKETAIIAAAIISAVTLAAIVALIIIDRITRTEAKITKIIKDVEITKFKENLEKLRNIEATKETTKFKEKIKESRRELDEESNKKLEKQNKQSPPIVKGIVSYEKKASLTGGILIALGLGIYSSLSQIFEFKPNLILILITMTFIIILFLDWLLLKLRVKHGWYGANAMEAIEIISFLKSHSNNNNDNDTNGYRIFQDPSEKHENTEQVGIVVDASKA